MHSKFQQILSEQKQKSLGFTIVELLIVVVIIGILAAIVIVAYNGVTQNAKASAIADGLKKFEKAVRLVAIDNGYATWPAETDIAGGATSTIAQMINNTPNFKKYMQSVPSVDGIAAGNWRYDNDGDSYNGCSEGGGGVNVYIANDMTDDKLDIMQKVDDMIDDGDLSCGKLRRQGGINLMYSISRTNAH